jgi:RNA polymerase sigma-B factor
VTASTLAERARTPAPFAELFERVIASMSEALFVVDRIRRVVTASGAAARLLAFDEEQLAVWRFSQTCQGVGVPTWVWELCRVRPTAPPPQNLPCAKPRLPTRSSSTGSAERFRGAGRAVVSADEKIGSNEPAAPGAAAATPTPKLGGTVDAIELFERWQRDRDPSAREQLVAQFLPLARTLALRYSGGSEALEDRVQVASLGLLKAIDRFDPRRDTTFTSYAVPTMLGELKRYFRDVGWSAHVPRRFQEAALRLRQAEEQLTVRLGRSPTVPELAQYLELSLDQTLDALQAAAAQHPVALEAPANEASGDDCLSIVETLGEDDTRFELLLCRLSIITAAGQLTVRQRCMLELRFGQELTLGQIAKRIGVSQMQVSRILRSTLTKINELVEHGQIGDRSAGDEVAHAVFLGAIDHAEPLAPQRSFPITPRLPQRNRPQPAMR